MPLNKPKTYSFVPTPVGVVRLRTRSARRSRLLAGGTYFRSRDRGEQANLLQLTAVEDLTLDPKEGLFIVHNQLLKPIESLSAINMALPAVSLFELNLNWNEEIRIRLVLGNLRAERYQLRWQVDNPGSEPTETLLDDLGPVFLNQVCSKPGVVTFMIPQLVWPVGGIIYIRPRVHWYTLERISLTDSETMLVTTGWGIEELRATVNGSDTWISMPERPGPQPAGPPLPSGPGDHEDVTDTGNDAEFLTVFDTTSMTGGDGLPATPVGLNTGPDRALVHLNYSEMDDGSIGTLNQILEWNGSSVVLGSWQRYY